MACVANCNKCTAATVAGCTEVATGYYSTGTVINSCDTNLQKCKNALTVYESTEQCRYGSLSAYSSGAWVAACQIGAPTGNCAINFKDSALATKCAQCSTGFALDLNTFTCVASGSCPSGSTELKDFKYKIKDITRQGHVCGLHMTHTTDFGELYYYNVNSCTDGYYLMKTGSQMDSYRTTGPTFELILCGKCHDTCLTCFDFSAYGCKSCPTGTVLYMSTCISACPAGYTADSSRVCQSNTCPVLTYTYITAGPTTNCVKKCPLSNFANNNTWTCDTCHADCDQCWGASNTDCRVCADSTGKYAYGNGSCLACATGTYIDADSAFNCSNFTMYSKLNNMPASAPSSHSELSGVTVVDTATNGAQTLTVDASSYVLVSSNGHQVNIPDITYTESRICFRYAIEMDLFFGTSSASWHNKQLFVKDAGTTIGTRKTNQWDFESALATYSSSFTVSKWRIFINNTNCTKKSISLSVSTDIGAAANWGIKNLRSYWYYCPLACISCTSSLSCARCEEGKFYYQGPNECQVPYTSLHPKPEEIVKSFSFLFKKNSVYLFFSKKMNFSLGDEFPYFFPSFYKKSSRLLQATGTPELTNSQVRFVGNNFMELYSPDYSTTQDTPGNYTFRYPLVDTDRVGYNFTGVQVVYLRNSLPYTFLLTYLELMNNNKFAVRIAFTAVIFFIVYAMGANWLMVENLQKLYLLLFFGVGYSADMEAIMDLMDFSFFGWFQILPELVLGANEYWDFIKYDEYISKYDKSREITTEFINYIPDGKLGKYLVRKSFIVHMINLILIFLFFGLTYAIFKPIKMCVVKKYYYKEKLVSVFNAIDDFLHFKFFVRFIMLTFPPFVFYGLANMSNLEFGKTNGMISAAVCLAMLAIWALAWLQYFVTAFFVPTPQEARNILPTWKIRLVLPFTEFMRYYKHPEDPYGMARATTDDDDNQKEKVSANDHMSIRDSAAGNKVFTMHDKRKVKVGGAMVFKKDDETELKPKDSKQKKKPGFIPIEKVIEMEQKELEKKKELREKQREKDIEKEIKDKEKEKKKDKADDAKDKKEKKEGEDSGSSSSESEGSTNSKGEKKKKDGKDGDSSESSDNSNTEDSEEQEIAGSDVRQVGRLLGRAVQKVQSGPGCCACMCIRKNKKIIKFNYWMERSAKFYSLIRLLHMALMSGSIWYFASSPFLQVIIFASTQTVFFVWSLLCRPYTYLMLNISLLSVEFCFTALAWLMFLLQGSILASLNGILYMIATFLCCIIFVLSVFTFIAFAILALVKWLSSLKSKDPM